MVGIVVAVPYVLRDSENAHFRDVSLSIWISWNSAKANIRETENSEDLGNASFWEMVLIHFPLFFLAEM